VLVNTHWTELITSDEVCSHTGQPFLSDNGSLYIPLRPKSKTLV